MWVCYCVSISVRVITLKVLGIKSARDGVPGVLKETANVIKTKWYHLIKRNYLAKNEHINYNRQFYQICPNFLLADGRKRASVFMVMMRLMVLKRPQTKCVNG